VEEYDPTIGKLRLLHLMSYCLTDNFGVNLICFQIVTDELMSTVVVT